MASVKRKCLSFETKLQLIEEIENGHKMRSEICREHGIAPSSLSTFFRDKEKIRAAVEQGARKPKRQRSSRFEDVDKALMVWFTWARDTGAPISGPILKEKAEELAMEMGHIDCKISGGWLDRFKLRHGIELRTINSASPAKDWLVERKDILQDFEPQNVFRVVETGLFYECLPFQSLTSMGEGCRQRVSIVCAINMNGGEKLPLLVVGKFKQPLCFKGVNIHNLPATYKSSSKALVTSTLFEEWVRQLDRRFLLQGRPVALIVDSCGAHPQLSDLRAIKIFFGPSHSTSRSQPSESDQLIVQTFKTIYRTRVLRKFISSYEETEGAYSYFKMSLLDALLLAARSWDDLEQSTIQKFFQLACIAETDDKKVSNPSSSSTGDLESPAKQHLKELRKLLHKISVLTNIAVQLSAEEYVGMDGTIQAVEDNTLTDCDSVSTSGHQVTEEEPAVDCDSEIPTVTNKVCVQALEQVRAYVLQQTTCDTSALQHVMALEDTVHKMAKPTKRYRQAKIDSFFIPVQRK
ncbi:tigger transposable element-derived protein 4 [Aplysia californica]|uniref:Tigger transposable element-derived protein 4 n=1 Tax=Aplysia californica TaxID=6500 RepID=A0ABM0JFI3_APLCA|nr:tigger transposable element-derived protein 4 [Aplysia californica]